MIPLYFLLVLLKCLVIVVSRCPASWPAICRDEVSLHAKFIHSLSSSTKALKTVGHVLFIQMKPFETI